MELRPMRNASIIAIKVYEERPEEAARIANEIAQTYKNRTRRFPRRDP